ncbi:MAG: biotin/lipoyl-containing protein, partial [Nannocystaceae bacterium]
LHFEVPSGEGIRCDVGVRTGQVTTGDYDPMVAKIIAHGSTREIARRRLLGALRRTILLGPVTNGHWLAQVLAHPALMEGEVRTDFLDSAEAAPLLTSSAVSARELAVAAALHVGTRYGARLGWRNSHPFVQPLRLSIEGERHDLTLEAGDGPGELRVSVGEAEHLVRIDTWSEADASATVLFDGAPLQVCAVRDGADTLFALDGRQRRCAPWSPASSSAQGESDGNVLAPTTGTVMRVDVSAGDEVRAGQPLLVVEAMKLETALVAPVDGVVEEVFTAPNNQIKKGALLVRISPRAAATPAEP